ncbi:T9SS type A sorting domain-containing protein [Psychroflexus planctonicus]|uniref:Secretion system C-terminal sorting domain-containing protein n=1 Tax=Psychroflexus planctonicus TaxID=1526575 RepID=A0ABQ1SGD7_9FLAO|nr:T9SS type A sorting domain-containing protein [Psychroflexus planctonicus]GGE36563.1 hypothetical protein GCM10010832_15940 [Psychroflexus planctonicus]
MKNLSLFIIFLICSQLHSQVTAIPDQGFEEELIMQNIDSDGIVNGEVLTADIASVTSLIISGNFQINDLIGIEDFVSLTYLDITNTELYLDNSFNANQELDLSNNVNLETLILYGGDDAVTNFVSSINLSNNPMISEITVPGNWMLNQINLRSGQTDVSDLVIDIGVYPPFQENDFCIKVTDESAANVGQGVYASWSINAPNNPFFFSENCTLAVEEFNASTVSVFPNPTAGQLEINSEIIPIAKLELYSISGKRIITIDDFEIKQPIISLQELENGIYLLKVYDNQKNSITKRIIKKD